MASNRGTWRLRAIADAFRGHSNSGAQQILLAAIAQKIAAERRARALEAMNPDEAGEIGSRHREQVACASLAASGRIIKAARALGVDLDGIVADEKLSLEISPASAAGEE